MIKDPYFVGLINIILYFICIYIMLEKKHLYIYMQLI